MSAASRYWDGMPADLAAIAQRNLAAEDRSISGFNERSKYFPTSAPTRQPLGNPVQSSSSFQFGLNGAADASQLSLNGIPSSPTANGVPATNAVSRVTPPVPSIASSPLSGPGSTFTSSPDAYKTSPDAYHQVISTYQPKDMSKERELYGWGQ